jgi:shikimate 5-dehydrogenase
VTHIDGETRIVAILGDPIAQAKSPQLFNALFERHGVNAVLVPFHVPATNLAVVLEGLLGVVNFAGVIVTVPHKLQARAYATQLSAAAQQAGAVNCLRRETDGSWTGAMFDGAGFVKVAGSPTRRARQVRTDRRDRRGGRGGGACVDRCGHRVARSFRQQCGVFAAARGSIAGA